MVSKNEIIRKAQRDFLHITEPKLAKAYDEIDRLKAEVERLNGCRKQDAIEKKAWVEKFAEQEQTIKELREKHRECMVQFLEGQKREIEQARTIKELRKIVTANRHYFQASPDNNGFCVCGEYLTSDVHVKYRRGGAVEGENRDLVEDVNILRGEASRKYATIKKLKSQLERVVELWESDNGSPEHHAAWEWIINDIKTPRHE